MPKGARAKPGTLKQSASEVVELSVNLDDQTGQVIGDALETLLDEGALDVWTTPIGMKKNRPGVMLSALVLPEDQARFSVRIIQLTGSFGVRARNWDRLVLERRHVKVKCALGVFRVKVGSLEGRVLVAQPEMQDVKKLAVKAGVTLRHAIRLAQAAAAKVKQETI